MIKAYLHSINFLEDEKSFLHHSQKIQEDRRRKIDALKQEADKKRSLAAEVILSFALKQEGVLHYEIGYQEFGKPYLKNSSLYFNLSHSGKYVLCGVSDGEIGVDIQKISYRLNPEKIAERFLGEKELAEISCEKEEKRADIFAALWAMKESYVKCTGKGIANAFRDISVSVKENCFEDLHHQRFQIVCSNKDQYKLAVCTKSKEKIVWKEINGY